MLGKIAHPWLIDSGGRVLVFLALFIRETWSTVLGGSNPAAGAVENTAHILNALQLLGTYAVFAVLVIGHGLLRPPPGSGKQDEPGG